MINVKSGLAAYRYIVKCIYDGTFNVCLSFWKEKAYLM